MALTDEAEVISRGRKRTKLELLFDEHPGLQEEVDQAIADGRSARSISLALRVRYGKAAPTPVPVQTYVELHESL